MKTIITIAVFTLITTVCFSQAPEAFNYSAVVRDGSGNPIANQNVNFRLSILSGSPGGASVYTETQAATTDVSGIVNLEIGLGSVVSGTFSNISWGTNSYFLQIEVDPAGGTAFQMMGTTQFLSVPYALYAKYAESTFPSSSTLDTISSASSFDNNFYSVTALPTLFGFMNIIVNDNNNITNVYYNTLLLNQFNGTQISSTFIGHYDQIPMVRTDKAGNIYFLDITLSDTTIDLNGTILPVTEPCASGSLILVKLNNAGVYQWSKFTHLTGCNGFLPYQYSFLDVDSVGNSYVNVQGTIKKYSTIGDSVAQITIPTVNQRYFNVNDKGEFATSTDSGLIKSYSAAGVLQWTRQLYSDVIKDIHLDNSGMVYISGCIDKCFSIDADQYCERADTKSTYKLIGLDNTGYLRYYHRFNNSPSLDNCPSVPYGVSLFTYNNRVAGVLEFATPFYNKGIQYQAGKYLVVF